MKIVLGADHAGYELKNVLRQHLIRQGFEIEDKGTDTADSVDYPDYARAVAESVLEDPGSYGILVCGTGIGMAISANKIPGIRAANCHNVFEAQVSREHNDANILALGARVLDPKDAIELVDVWLKSSFAAGGRHERRVQKIHDLEQQEWKRVT